MLSTLVDNDNFDNRNEIDFHSYNSNSASEPLFLYAEYSAGDDGSSIAQY